MQLKSLSFKASSVDLDERTFKGYASTWDLDQGGDLILKGAFAKTLKEAGANVKVLWQHYEPIGRPLKMEEDDTGLFVEAKVSKTRLGDEALELMKDGVIDRMSIGYRIPEGKSDYNGETGVRIIRELKLMEFSVVTFPMNEAAVITDVKRVRDMVSVEHNFNKKDLKQLAEMVDEINALLKREPPRSTPGIQQPHDEIADLCAAIETFKI